MTRVAVVTGGSSGIGRATVEHLERGGVKVAVLDAQGDPPVDVSDATAVAAAIEEPHRLLGGVGILVNGAGIPAGGPIEGDGYLEPWERGTGGEPDWCHAHRPGVP